MLRSPLIIFFVFLLPFLGVGQSKVKFKAFSLNDTYQIVDLEFSDKSSGRLLAVYTPSGAKFSTSVLMSTANAGKTWETVVEFPQSRLTHYLKADGFEMLSGTSYGEQPGLIVMKSTDGWKTNQVTTPGDPIMQSSVKLFQCFENGDVLLVTNLGWKSLDGGETWGTQALLPKVNASGNVTAAAFYDMNHGMVLSDDGSLIRKAIVSSTANGGKQWTARPFVEERLSSADRITCPSANVAYLLKGGSRLYKTVDAGKTWKELELKTKASYRQVLFINERVGFIVGLKGHLLVTSDGGKSWETHAIGHGYSFLTIEFVDYKTGYIAGANGALFRVNIK